MSAFLIRRLTGALLTMLIVVTIVFFVTNVIPGSPAAVILGEDRTAEQVAELNRELGLDRSLPVRYLTWISDLLSGDLGTSYFNGSDVRTVILQRVEPTLILTATSALLAIAIGIPLGVIAALYRGSAVDFAAMVAALTAAALPNFWLGLLLVLLLSLYWGIFPAAGYVSLFEDPGDAWRYLVLPSITLGASHAGVIARIARANLLEEMGADYLRTARAKGLRQRSVIVGHALRNSLVPTLGVVGVAVALMVGGSVVTETVFAIPGIGRLLIESVLGRDFPMIQGTVLVIAVFVALVNLLVDITYALIDPRIRHA
ncbi:ABC transporter permease [Aestuariibius sp. 2305UL40-4]|uniref:ABC transporter permease n=1 Tax=Aestuariibius violaceus TaxID=3234132 RepID=UPI00345E4136